jgi:hypothetical protein
MPGRPRIGLKYLRFGLLTEQQGDSREYERRCDKHSD